MSSILFLLTLVGTASCKAPVAIPVDKSRVQQNPEVFPYVISKFVFSIIEIENKERNNIDALVPINNANTYARVPFGAMNETWKYFKGLVQPGDEIHQWANGDGGAPKGYCIIRNGRVAATFTSIILFE